MNIYTEGVHQAVDILEAELSMLYDGQAVET